MQPLGRRRIADYMLICALFLMAATASAQDFQSPLILSPYSVSFGNVLVGEKSREQTVTILNVGASSARVTEITIAGNFEQTNNCPLPPEALATNDACQIEIAFKPATPGPSSGRLIVSSGTRGALTVDLNGLGAADIPTVRISPAALSFPARAPGTNGPAQTVTVSNSGAETVIFTGITASGDFTILPSSTCVRDSDSLSPGTDCTVAVTFTPLGTGQRDGEIVINDNAMDSPQRIKLSGTGQAPENGPVQDRDNASGIG